MFTPLQREQIEILDADTAVFENSYGNIKPSELLDTSNFEFSFFSDIGAPIREVTSRVVYKQPLKEYSTFCFTINKDEAFFHIKDVPAIPISQTELTDNRANDISDVIVEYVARKFLAYAHSHYKLEPRPRLEFVGLDSTQSNTICDQGIEIKIRGDNFQTTCLLTLPQNFLASIVENNKSGNPAVDSIKPDGTEEDVQLRFDIASFLVSTNSLIDIVKGGEIITLPSSASFDTAHVQYENGEIGTGKLKRLDEQIMCVFDHPEATHSNTFQKTGNEPQSVLTCSLGYYSYSTDQLKKMPRVFPLEGCKFPKVLLIVGNEVIAHGELGLFESPSLCVRVSA